MRVIELPPKAHTLINATRHIGYSLEAAVADLVDNSIAAGAKNIDISFEDQDNHYIAILDDGSGMDDDELTAAMQYGSADPSRVRSEKDLGRYGLGLKTASMSQCRRMTVISKKNGELSARQWDLDYIKKHQREVWPLIVLDRTEWNKFPCVEWLDRKKSGTVVIWQNIDFGGTYDAMTFDEEMDKTTEHLSLVFHRYLYGEGGIGKIRIRVHDRLLKPKDPFLQYIEDGKHGHQCKATQMIGTGADRISLQAFTLPHDKELTDKMRDVLGIKKSLRRTQGFYIYRNKRLITYGSWFGLKVQGEFFKLSRIKVDIPNSVDIKWALDVKKSTAVPPKEVISHLRAYVESVVKQSKNAIRVQVFGKKEPKTPQDIQPWHTLIKDGAVSAIRINREHSAVKSILEANPVVDKLMNMLERTIPIDAIYYSRSEEQKLENEMPFSVEELKEMMAAFLAKIPKGIARKQTFQAMLLSEPFVMQAESLKKFEEEILDANV